MAAVADVPGTGAAFGFIVEQVLATKSRNAILLQKGGEFALAGIPELVSTPKVCDAPPQQLASEDWRRFSATRAAVRAVLSWPRGDEPTRRLRCRSGPGSGR